MDLDIGYDPLNWERRHSNGESRAKFTFLQNWHGQSPGFFAFGPAKAKVVTAGVIAMAVIDRDCFWVSEWEKFHFFKTLSLSWDFFVIGRRWRRTKTYAFSTPTKKSHVCNLGFCRNWYYNERWKKRNHVTKNEAKLLEQMLCGFEKSGLLYCDYSDLHWFMVSFAGSLN